MYVGFEVRAGIDLAHTQAFEDAFGKPKDVESKNIHPTTWHNWKIPKTPLEQPESEPYLWGRLCDQVQYKSWLHYSMSSTTAWRQEEVHSTLSTGFIDDTDHTVFS